MSNFSKHWEASVISKTLKSINKDFYPIPIIEKHKDTPLKSRELIHREGDYLSITQLIEAHGRCGNLMHAQNPFGKQLDIAIYMDLFTKWRDGILNLLSTHLIKLVNDTGFYLVHMQEHDSNEVHWYRFVKTELTSITNPSTK